MNRKLDPIRKTTLANENSIKGLSSDVNTSVGKPKKFKKNPVNTPVIK